jgi:hypothetical protein
MNVIERNAAVRQNHIVVTDGFTLNPGDNPWSDVEQLGTLAVYGRTSPGAFGRPDSG